MGITDPIHFEVKALHIELLKRLNFQEGEGVPEVSAKRPYGNSDVLGDLQEIYSATAGHEVLRLEDGGTIVLQGDRVISRGDGTGRVEDDTEAMLWEYHRQMSTVLEILVDNLGIQEGTYSCVPFGGKWTLRED